MKKIVSLILSIVMLLSFTAFAENMDLAIGNIVVSEGETALLDLSGLFLTLGTAQDAAGNTGIKLALGTEDEDCLTLGAIVKDEKVLLNLTGVSNVYSVDTKVITDLVQSNIAPAMEGAGVQDIQNIGSMISDADKLALSGLAMQAIAAFSAGMTPGEAVEIDGTTFEVLNIAVAEETIQPLLQQLFSILDNYSELLAETGIESFSQIYDELKPSLGFEGQLMEADEKMIIDFTINGAVQDGAMAGYLNLYLYGSEYEDDTIGIYIEASAGSGEQVYTLAFSVGMASGVDGSWLPASDAPVDLLTAVADENQSQILMMEALGAAMGAMSQLAAANETVAALVSSMMAA